MTSTTIPERDINKSCSVIQWGPIRSYDHQIDNNDNTRRYKETSERNSFDTISLSGFPFSAGPPFRREYTSSSLNEDAKRDEHRPGIMTFVYCTWHVYFILHVADRITKPRFGNNLCNRDIHDDEKEGERARGRGWNTNRIGIQRIRVYRAHQMGIGKRKGETANERARKRERETAFTRRYIPCTDLRYRSLAYSRLGRACTIARVWDR